MILGAQISAWAPASNSLYIYLTVEFPDRTVINSIFNYLRDHILSCIVAAPGNNKGGFRLLHILIKVGFIFFKSV